MATSFLFIYVTKMAQPISLQYENIKVEKQ